MIRVGIVPAELPSPLLGEEALRAWLEDLRSLGVDAALVAAPAMDGEVTHHLGFGRRGQLGPHPTVLTPAAPNAEDLRWLRDHGSRIEAFVTPSQDAQGALQAAGISSSRIHPLGVPANPRIVPRRLAVGIFNKVHWDGVTRHWLLPNLADRVDLTAFHFTIMGADWQSTVDDLRSRGVSVSYLDRFDRDAYARLMPSLDYFLYLGMDEGSMAFVDAVAAGVKTIATAQGYHLDAAEGLTHPFTELEELVTIFAQLAAGRARGADSVHAYAEAHVQLWRALVDPGLSRLPEAKSARPRLPAPARPSPLRKRLLSRLQARLYRN